MEKKLFAKRVVEVGYMINERIEHSLKKSKIMKINDMEYFVHPLCDGCIPIDIDLLNDAGFSIYTQIVERNLEFPNKVVCIESMGIPIGMSLADYLDAELVIIRKRDYIECFPNQVAVEVDKGYQKDNLYINSIESDDLVFIVDDVIASGETLNKVIGAIRYTGAIITGAGAIVEIKGASEKIDPAIETFALVNVAIKNGKVVII